ncbi:Nitrate transporter 1.2 [Triticum urartu]|uniref:Nitrate transporter 1.2 n=2 Tax=Triticum urartu TaxID=4572 RepID=M8AJN7_TRIUA|nr:protein NRT1/ PTR FAMILY 4.6-like [Triticum urartu]EMS61009.1 Nitrate transporter 1.2 [Triticum urartu]
MELEGCVDWRGNDVDRRKHGGIKATIFLYVLVVLRSCPNSANFSLVAYFHRILHLDIVTSSAVITYLVGAIFFFAALMNFIAGAYIQRTTAIFVFSPLAVLGYMLLALQAYLPSLHPLDCEINKEPNNCESAKGWSLTLLYLSLLMFAIGEGCMRACIPLLGGDQFSNDDPKETHLKSTFLSWIKFANSVGALMGLVFLVWIENNLGWALGFMISALIVLVGLFVAASGLPFYRTQKPNGSPLKGILQVLVTSSKKRQVATIDVIELQEIGAADSVDGEGKSESKSTGTTQVEELTKAITRMLPIFISCLLIYLPFTLLMTLTIQVGSTMDKGIGVIQIPSASLIAIPTAFHMLMQPCYRQILTPLLKRFTGHTHGITPLQSIGAGSVCGVAAACLAALVETRRLTVAEQHGLTLTGAGVPMSVFWLVLQFFLLSIMDAASFSGLIEFIKSESSPEMKLIAPAMQSIVAGIAAWLACAFIQLANNASRHRDGGRGWLDGADFNRTRLDRFFLLLAGFEFVALINYAFWARRYAKKQRSSGV